MADLAQYDAIFKAAGEEWDVDPLALKAIATQESGGNRYARSKANAQGLMQIIPETQRHLGMTDPHDPEQAIFGGAKYMAEALAAERDNPSAALLYYHGGPGWRQSYGPESRGYVPAVTAHYQRLAKADTGTGTDATPAQPAPAAGGQAVSANPPAASKSTDDDPFSAALGGGEPKASAGGGETRKAATDDPFTAALGKGGEPTAEPPGDRTPAGAPKAIETDSGAGSARAADLGIPGRSPSAAPPATPTTPANLLDTGRRIADAAVTGYQQTPGILSDNALAAVEGVPIVGQDLGFLARAGGAAIKAGGGLFRGVQEAVAGAGDAVSPGLGRGLAGMMEVAPEAMRAHPLQPGAVAQVPARIAENRAANAAPLSPEFKANPLAPEVAARIAADPPNQLVLGPDGQPVPRSVGAAGSREGTPAGQIAMTPAEMKANRRQAELGEILTPAEPGDATMHVKGSLPTKAEYSGDPLVSQQENLLRQRNPKAFEGEGGRLTENNTARVAHYEDMTPSDTTLERWTRERGEQAAKDNEAIVANAKPADAQPVVDTLDGILNDKRNMNRESVQKNLGAYRERLFNKDGTLKSDPQELWGIRDDLTEKLDKIGKDPQSTMGYVKKETLAIRDAIDQTLNTATDGRFQTFLDNYADKSQQINAGHLLREFRANLTNAKGDILANRFHNFVKDLAENRGKGGIDPAMDISDTTMQGLIALDKDLKRAGLIDLGKARGSPTNLYGAIAKGMGLGAAHAVTATMAPSGGIGNLILQGVIDKGSQIGGHILLNRKTQQHLAPPPEGYRNPLQPPT